MANNNFTKKELAFFYGVLRNNHEFLELQCGCTVSKYGDTAGKLRVYGDGKLEIDCDCYRECHKVNLNPVEFAKHAGKSNAYESWKSQIWVFKKNGTKVRLSKTCLLKYHTTTYERPPIYIKHRDEFLKCSQCAKILRFSMRTKKECKLYHDAIVANNWKCSDMPGNAYSCDDPKERETRLVSRGCVETQNCTGCEKCCCFGCDRCRFENCGCQDCVVYFANKFI